MPFYSLFGQKGGGCRLSDAGECTLARFLFKFYDLQRGTITQILLESPSILIF
jgi:ABC-type transport system involved in Fe-S cluster assembly fused permease/ATPase subunit